MLFGAAPVSDGAKGAGWFAPGTRPTAQHPRRRRRRRSCQRHGQGRGTYSTSVSKSISIRFLIPAGGCTNQRASHLVPMLTALAVIAGSAVMIFDPIFKGLAIALMAGEMASLVLSRMTVPVLYFMV